MPDGRVAMDIPGQGVWVCGVPNQSSTGNWIQIQTSDVYHVRLGGGELVMVNYGDVYAANLNPNLTFHPYQSYLVTQAGSQVTADVDANGTIVWGVQGGGVYAYGGYYGAPYEFTTCNTSVVAG
jgi:hypothetical protein